MARSISKAEPEQLRTFAIEAARLMEDRHCEGVVLLDVRGLSQVCDYILIGSGTSDRQMRAVAEELEDLGDMHANACFRRSADNAATWIVTDFVDLVVHLFEPTHRTYYDLEELWADAPHVPWERSSDAAASD